MDNPVLLNKVIEGDIEAYSLLYKEYYRKLYNYGRKFSHDTALVEDCIQEIFFDLWSRRNKLEKIDSLNSYLYSAFRYTLIKKLKDQQRLSLREEHEEDATFEFSVENVIIEQEQNAEDYKSLKEACKFLTPRQYEAIFLRYYEKLSYQEVADILKISVKATYKIMARSISTLKDNIKLLLFLY